MSQHHPRLVRLDRQPDDRSAVIRLDRDRLESLPDRARRFQDRLDQMRVVDVGRKGDERGSDRSRRR
ncbi:MAG TPA: hypothetical protein DCQ98_00110 [Planctomycetaceae bacterium]|nr:hypothetical protein [Planctomycetaceae bacterium]